MGVNFKELQELQRRLEQEVIQRTPTTNNNKLKNNWKKRVVANKNGTYTVEVYNDLEYASSVEYGSKNADNGWNEGKFMMTITSQMIQQRMNSIAQPKIDKFLKGVFK